MDKKSSSEYSACYRMYVKPFLSNNGRAGRTRVNISGKWKFPYLAPGPTNSRFPCVCDKKV